MVIATDVRWWPATCTDIDVHRLVARHYTRNPRRQRIPRFVGPGECMVLVTADALACFVWRRFIDDCPLGGGISCAVFRNEGEHLSSELVMEADELADARWGKQRHYTFVNPAKVRSTNPGYCFLRAGWRRCGVTPKGLVCLERPWRTD